MRRFTVGRVVLFLPLTAIIIAGRLPIRDNSFLWHIRAGELQLERGSVLTQDPFSFTAGGEPWRTQSWLADLLYGFFERLEPLAVGPWVTVISGAVVVYAVAIRAYRRVDSAMVAGVCALIAMWVALGWFSPRPVVISLALFSLFLVVSDDPGLRWALPLAMWLWASVHGGFIVGVGYLVLDYIAYRRRSRLVDILMVSGVVLFTAHGWGVVDVLLNFLAAGPALDIIVEWDAPDFFELALAPFLVVLVAVLFVARRSKLPNADLAVVVPFLLFAFTSSRAVPLATLVLIPWVAESLRPLARFGNSPGSPALSMIATATVAVALIIPIEGGLAPERFPLEAAQHLTAERVFHDDGAGGYIIYHQYPQRLVYVDDRAELYGERFIQYGEAKSGLPVWRKVFEKWEIEESLLKSDSPLLQILREAGWEERFADAEYVVVASPTPSSD